jgi:hypothetical protein
MSAHPNNQEIKDTMASEKPRDEINRRDFSRNILAGGVLSALGLITIPERAEAWLDGNFRNRDDLGDALKMVEKTYSVIEPYPHKFNDALVKLLLRDLDFAVKKGIEKEFCEDYVARLGVLVNKHLQKGVDQFGDDIFLWAMFERTSCGYQLFDHIDIKIGKRSVPCPFKPMLNHLAKEMGTYKIVWEDVCSKWCSPTWHNFIKGAGLMGRINIKVEPGDTCTIRVV